MRVRNSLDRRILGYSKPARRLLYASVAAGFVAAAMAVALAWLLSVAIAGVLVEQQTRGELTALLVAALGLAFVRAGALWAGEVLAQCSAGQLKSRLRTDLLHHLSELGPSYVGRERSGELTNLIGGGVEDLDDYIAAYQPLRYLAMLVPVFVAFVILLLDPLSVLVVLITGPVLVLFLVLIGSRAKEITERRFVEMSWMSAQFLDFLQGLATLKMLGRSREQAANIREASRRYGNTTMSVLRTAFETSFVLELSTTIATALVAVEVGLRLFHGSLSFEHALALVIITPEFFLPVRQLSARYHAGAAGKAAAERIFAVLDRPAPAALGPILFRGERASDPAHPEAFEGRAANVVVRDRTRGVSGDGIALVNVSFAYDGGRRLALDGVSLHIPRGSTVALVGATGAGKTTVASVLLRFIEPANGAIVVDGLPLESIDVTEWRRQVAWVPQHPHLFGGTVAENIRLGRPDASHQEVLAAAAAAHVDEFVRRLPGGYDTLIGERGVRLSGGEQQRVAIARALLRDAPFLVLDEPTSHLDAESEALVVDALERLLVGRTALIIAHRMSLAYRADRVVVMHEGRVVEEGSHDELMGVDQHYRRLVTLFEAGSR